MCLDNLKRFKEEKQMFCYKVFDERFYDSKNLDKIKGFYRNNRVNVLENKIIKSKLKNNESVQIYGVHCYTNYKHAKNAVNYYCLHNKGTQIWKVKAEGVVAKGDQNGKNAIVCKKVTLIKPIARKINRQWSNLTWDDIKLSANKNKRRKKV